MQQQGMAQCMVPWPSVGPPHVGEFGMESLSRIL